MTDISSDYGSSGEVSFSPDRGETSNYPYFSPHLSNAFTFSFQNLGKEAPGPAKMYVTGYGDVNSGRLVLPVAPANISITPGNDQQTVTSISGFEYTHGGSFGLEEIQFESFLPALKTTTTEAVSRLDGDLEGFISPAIKTTGYLPPLAMVNRFKTAMKASQPLIFSVYLFELLSIPEDPDFTRITTETGTSNVFTDVRSCIIEPTTVTISDFTWSMGNDTGGSSLDIAYSMTLKKWRKQSLKFNAKLPQQNTTTATTTAPVVINPLDPNFIVGPYAGPNAPRGYVNAGTVIPVYNPPETLLLSGALRTAFLRCTNYLNGDAQLSTMNAKTISKDMFDIVKAISTPALIPVDNQFYKDIKYQYDEYHKPVPTTRKKEELLSRYRNLLSGLRNSLGVSPASSLGGTPSVVGRKRNREKAIPKSHTIQPDDTLSSISYHYYGTTSRVNEIRDLNSDILQKRTIIEDGEDFPTVVPIDSTLPVIRKDGGVEKQYSKVQPPTSTIKVTDVTTGNKKSKLIVPKYQKEKILRLPKR